MGRFRQVRSPGRPLHEKEEKLVFYTVSAATFIFILSIPTLLVANVMLDESQFQVLHLTTQTAVVFISFSVFFIQWLTPRNSRSLQSMFIGAAFLSVGALKFLHMVTYRGLLPTILIDESDMSTYFGTSANLTLAATLLVAGFVPSVRGRRWHSLSVVLLPFLAFTVTVSAAIIFFLDKLPSLLDEGEGVTVLRTVMQLAILAALVAAAAVYHRLGNRTKDIVYSYLSAAAILGAYSSIAYLLYAEPSDSFSMLAHVYDVACFAMIFVALFRVSVTEPYDELLRAKGVIEKRRREAEAASMKAQTYLDFLSHDIANMISPIMSYAEMIERHEASPEECRKYASRIQDQTKKTSSLISNLRRLARTEKRSTGALSELDLRAYIPEAVREVKAENPGRRVEFESHLPDTPEVMVVGGGVAEEIVSEVLRNAAKHGCDGTASIQIVVSEVAGGPGHDFWHIDVTDHGPGIPDTRKKSLLSGAFGEESRMSRGVVSNLPLMSLIAEQLGGRIKIEDRVPGDHTQGAKVVIVLPMARPH